MSKNLVQKVNMIAGKTALSLALLVNTGCLEKEKPSKKTTNPILEEIIEVKQDYKFILPFIKPERRTEKHIFENNDVINYMNWLRVQKYRKKINESIEYATKKDQKISKDGRPRWLSSLNFAIKRYNDLNEYINVEDIKKCYQMKPFPNPLFYQEDQNGNLIEIKSGIFTGTWIDFNKPEIAAQDFLSGIKNENIKEIKMNLNKHLENRLMTTHDGSLIEILKTELGELNTQEVYKKNISTEEQDKEVAKRVEEWEDGGGRFEKINLIVVENGFKQVLSLYLINDYDERYWKVYDYAINNGRFESQMARDMMDKSRRCNKSAIFTYPSDPRHNGKLYGVTKGFNAGSDIKSIRERKLYKYEFFEYSNREWSFILRFNEKERLSLSDISSIRAEYNLDEKVPHYVSKSLLKKIQ
jgi:hypothetical protein